jgi:hypothetical protein
VPIDGATHSVDCEQSQPIGTAEALLDALRAVDAAHRAAADAAKAKAEAEAEAEEKRRRQLRASVLRGDFDGIDIDLCAPGLASSGDPEVRDAILAEQDRRRKAREAAAAERKAKAAAEAKAQAELLRRLAGLSAGDPVTVEVAMTRGNPRRYGAPWIGEVIALSGTGRPELRWGLYEDGRLILAAAPGALVMYGQRDHRGANTERHYAVVDRDGTLVRLGGRAAAIAYWAQRAE